MKIRAAVVFGLLFGLLALMAPPASAVVIYDTPISNGHSGYCLMQYGYHVNGGQTSLTYCGNASYERWSWLQGQGYKRLMNTGTQTCLNGTVNPPRVYSNYPCDLGARIDFVQIYGYYGAFLIKSAQSPHCLAAGDSWPLAWYGCTYEIDSRNPMYRWYPERIG